MSRETCEALYVITGTHRKHGGGGCCEREGNGPENAHAFFLGWGLLMLPGRDARAFLYQEQTVADVEKRPRGCQPLSLLFSARELRDQAPAPRPARPHHCSGLGSLPGALFRVTFSKGRVVAWFLSLF